MSEPSGTCHEQVSMDIETGLCMKKSSSLDYLDFLVEKSKKNSMELFLEQIEVL